MKRRIMAGIFFGALIALSSIAFASPASHRDAEQAGDCSGRTGTGVKP
jgi:hypothetical protein